MSLAPPSRCPDCGGNLYLEPDLIEAMADLVCLQCSRRFRHGRGPRSGAASRLLPGDRAPTRIPTNPTGDPC
jgi:hypothetical protein